MLRFDNVADADADDGDVRGSGGSERGESVLFLREREREREFTGVIRYHVRETVSLCSIEGGSAFVRVRVSASIRQRKRDRAGEREWTMTLK